MPALDTNVLVRHLVRDDQSQADVATQLLTQQLQQGEPLYVPVTVVLELEWVLRARYRLPKASVMEVLAALFSAMELVFESEQSLEVALQLYRQSAADFADALHLALAIKAGAAPLHTFDRAAARLPGARLLGG